MESGRSTPGEGRTSATSSLGQRIIEHFNDNVPVTAQLEDVEVLDNIDDILSVEGIDVYASGAQDIAQSMAPPRQPNHPKVQEFEATIVKKVHAAGKKTSRKTSWSWLGPRTCSLMACERGWRHRDSCHGSAFGYQLREAARGAQRCLRCLPFWASGLLGA